MAASVVLNSYTPETGCLDFTISGTPTPVAVTVQKSIDGGLTWINSTGGITSPRCGYIVTVPTIFRIRLENGGELSNEISSQPITITPIENETDISFCNSPIHIRLQNQANDTTIQSANLYLYIWTGAQNQILDTPTHTFYKEKVSISDNYINIEISDFIKSFLINPPTAPNTNQPNFSYNEIGLPAITGQGVFWQVVADVTSTGVTERFNFRTSFATLGYRYDNEQTFTNVFSAVQPDYPRWYNNRIHDYFKQSFDFTKSVAEATTGNLIKIENVTPPVGYTRESLTPYLIVFLNKIGLWDVFTPNSKVLISNKITRTTSNIGFRDPSRIDNTYVHSKLNEITDVEQSIQIETGSLTEDMVELVKQIVYSPKIYLIRFLGDVQTTTTVGITIDNTYVTVDSLLTTIDGLTVTDEYLAYFKSHQQIPVILTDTDFVEMNRVNDKNKIDYKLKFETTTNNILDL